MNYSDHFDLKAWAEVFRSWDTQLSKNKKLTECNKEQIRAVKTALEPIEFGFLEGAAGLNRIADALQNVADAIDRIGDAFEKKR